MHSRIFCRYPRFLLLLIFLLIFQGSYTLSLQASDKDGQTRSYDVNLKGQEPCDTTIEILWGSVWSYYCWKQPPTDEFLNMRFEMPLDHGGRLEYLRCAFYERGSAGTPNPDFYVWLSDGTFPLDNNPPSQAIAEFHVDYNDVAWYPNYTTVQTYSLGIEFEAGEMFHIGGSHAFEPGDTLAYLSDDGVFESDRASGWHNGEWESYYPYEFAIDAAICPFAPESTFTMSCSPSLAFGTPGDPPGDLYAVYVGAVLGYSLNVTLSLLSVTPTANISATFTPNGVPPPYASDVTVTIDPAVPFGDYTLTFQALGDDGQTKTCDVTLRAQPPYDEVEVDFNHGMQRASNFGAVGNDHTGENFMWYGTNYMFDGTFLIATTDPDHMALDVYNCEHWGWNPTQHLDVYYDPEYNANIAYANFYSDSIPGEHDSVFIVGPMAECVDFSIKIKIYYNPTGTPIPELYAGVFEDWNISDAYNNWVDMDTLHNLMWQWDPADPSIVFGIMQCPFYDEFMHSMVGVNNAYYVWPNAGFCDSSGNDPGYEFYGLDSLYALMTTPQYRWPIDINPDSNDMSLLITGPPFSLNPGEKHIEIWIDFGRNLNDGLTWEQWYHRVLKYVGFYRGSVTGYGHPEIPNLSDLIYLINYLYRDGPAPVPHADQGDVNADRVTDLGDLVYLINFIFKDGPPLVDYVRFIPSMWSRESLFLNPNW